MKIVVIDGQGGGMGKSIVQLLRKELPGADLVAVGTNSAATSAMLKAGAPVGATGENAVVYNCADADLIVGAIGIGFANSMHGEISPVMAQAVSQSRAKKLLIPMNRCNVRVLGSGDNPLSDYLRELAEVVRQAGETGCGWL